MSTNTLAVVPIFMSAGAAVMPTLMAIFTSILAIILKPRELVALCRRRPLTALTSLFTAALLVFIIVWSIGAAGRAASHASRPPTRIDWAKVAEDILAKQEALAAMQSPTTSHDASPTTSTPAPATPIIASLPLIEAHDSARTSYAGGPSPMNLKPIWSFHPEDSMFLSAPLITPTRIFTAACQSDLGGYTGLLACLDASTGKPLWQLNELAGNPMLPFFSSPALTADGKYLLIGQGLHQDHDCSLLCFEAATGKFRWSVKTSLHIESSPAIFGDIAVVGAGAIEGPDGRATGDTGHVIAVRISDGYELWRHPVIDPESSPVFDDTSKIFIGSGFNGSAVVALRSEPSEELKSKNLDRIAWRTSLPDPVTSDISIIGDAVIAGGGNSDVVHSAANAHGFVAALDRATGKIRWQTPFADAVLGGVAAREGTLIAAVRTGEVAALSLTDGRVLWRTRISGKAPIIASCAFTGDRIYAVSTDGYLAILDPKNGKILEKIYLNDQSSPGTGLSMSPPQVADGKVFVGSETGGLHCFVGTTLIGGKP